MTIREGKWKCTYCEMINRGRDLKCASCGATREKDVEFIYDENAPEITDEAELARAGVGADWLCETCGTSNPNERSECKQCGAPRGASQQRAEKMVAPPVPPPPPPAPPRQFPTKIFAALGAIALVFIVLALYFTRTHETQLTVSNVEWQRAIEVEELKTLTEQDWQDAVPRDARIISRRSEFHHNEKVKIGEHAVERTVTEKVQVGTKRVKTGTKDLGNGYFKDIYEDRPVYENRERHVTEMQPTYIDRPVYRDKVTYQVDRWQTVNTARAQGNDNSPRWPDVNANAKLRAGKRTEKYLVSLKDPKSGKSYQQEVSAADFPHFVPGSVCRASINNLGTIKNLIPAK